MSYSYIDNPWSDDGITVNYLSKSGSDSNISLGYERKWSTINPYDNHYQKKVECN